MFGQVVTAALGMHQQQLGRRVDAAFEKTLFEGVQRQAFIGARQQQHAIRLPQAEMRPGTVGFVAAIPYITGACAMTLWARLANRSARRMPYVISALCLAAVALVASGFVDGAVLKVACLSVAVASILAFQATFWAIPSSFLTGRAAAGGLALIVSIGNLGGFAGPSMIGLIKDFSQSFTGPLFAVASVLLVGALTMFLLGDPASREPRRGKDMGVGEAAVT